MKKSFIHPFLAFIAIAGFLLPLLLIALVRWSDLPLGVSGNWEWVRISPPTTLLPTCLLSLLCFAAAAFAAWRMDTHRLSRSTAIVVILLCGLLADLAILHGGRAGLAENALAPLNAFATGYLEAAATAEKPGDLTRHFSARVLRVPTGEVPQHRHVHPPGNVLLSAVLFNIPGHFATKLLPGTAEALAELAREGILMPPMDTPQARETALRLVLLFLGALTAGRLLLFLALRRFRLPGAGVAALLITFGSGTGVLFLGHYDTFYFLITAAAAFIAVTALGRHSNRRIPLLLWGVLGLILGTGALFSLGFGAPILLGMLLIVLSGRDRWLRLSAYAAGGFAVPGIAALSGMNLPAIALRCWENHRLFNAMAGRAYWPWAAYNLLDALLFAGVAVTLLIFGAFFLQRRHPAGRVLIPAAGVWLFLLFSGSASGEFGRLTVLYVPVLLAGGAFLLARATIPKQSPGRYFLLLAGIGLALLQTAVLRESLKLVLID